jgi:hypothetical protein
MGNATGITNLSIVLALIGGELDVLGLQPAG